MAVRQIKRDCPTPRPAGECGCGFRLRLPALAVPLATLPAPLEHGALGVWDEVAVGALLVGCAVVYAVWFYLSGRGEKPHDSE